MSHSNTVLSQLLKLLPRHEFEKLANTVDGKVRSTALSRWSSLSHWQWVNSAADKVCGISKAVCPRNGIFTTILAFNR